MKLKRPALALLLLASALLSGCGGSVLYSHLAEQQANEVTAALIDRGIDARKEQSGRSDDWEVLVDRGHIPSAMAILRNQGLPHQSADISKMFQKQGLVSSPLEDKQRFIYAREQQLGATLRQLDGVIDASVYLSIPDKDPMSDAPTSGSASVVIIASPNADIKSQALDIKSAVMNGTEGLTDPTRVSVTVFHRTPTAVSQAAAPIAGISRDAGSLVLLGLAALVVFFAALLLWRNRKTLTGGSSVAPRTTARTRVDRER